MRSMSSIGGTSPTFAAHASILLAFTRSYQINGHLRVRRSMTSLLLRCVALTGNISFLGPTITA